jgi:hypothetical protein
MMTLVAGPYRSGTGDDPVQLAALQFFRKGKQAKAEGTSIDHVTGT